MNKRIKGIITITVLTLSILAFLLSGFSCTKEEHETIIQPSSVTELTGKWHLTIKSLTTYKDTTTVKGVKKDDLGTGIITHENVYLYELNNKIEGFMLPFEIRGTRNGNSIVLDIYEPQDGRYTGPYDSVELMIKSVTINLTMDEFGHLKGKGRNLLDVDDLGLDEETFEVFGKKVDDFKKSRADMKFTAINDWKNTLCDILAGSISFLAGILSDNAVRPMGGCYLVKNGGGYYIFGDYGPGSLLPVWTQNIFYPIEVAVCTSRKYKFHIKTKEAVMTMDALGLILQQSVKNFEMNFPNTNWQNFNDLFTKTGGFAISVMIDRFTGNASIYLNTFVNSVNSHTVVEGLKTHLSKFFNVSIHAGKDIEDSWHLVRSPVPATCNSPLIILYLLGTNKVQYN